MDSSTSSLAPLGLCGIEKRAAGRRKEALREDIYEGLLDRTVAETAGRSDVGGPYFMTCSCSMHHRWMTISGAHRRADTLQCKGAHASWNAAASCQSSQPGLAAP